MPIVGSIIKGALELRSRMPDKKRVIKRPFIEQNKILKKLLRKAQYTSFGEYYRFEEILASSNKINEFKKRVPVFDYTKMHYNWWYRTLSGEQYVSWPGRVKYFALSSGTSGSSSKYIPLTTDMLKAIKKTSVRQLVSLVKYDLPREFFEKGILMLGGSTHLNFNGTYYEGDLSGITTGNLPFWFQHYYKPGKRISKERDWSAKLEEIVNKATEWDIGAIVGVPAWMQILLEKIIDRYKLKHIHEIWPNLTIFCHGGVSFTPYIKTFEKLLGKPLIYIETYLASEGFFAYQNRPNTNSMKLVFDNGIFYEFIPYNKTNFDTEGNLIENPETLTVNEIKENEDYALLVSTVAGAWRFLIGDVIRFTSKEELELQIVGRTKHYLSVCGEHLSVENMDRAIEMLENKFNIGVKEYTVAGIPYGTMFAHKWWIGTDDNIDVKLAAQKIDEYLKVLNDDYRVERIAAIKNVEAIIVKPINFYNYLKMNGKEGGQFKFPRVLKGQNINEWESYVEKIL